MNLLLPKNWEELPSFEPLGKSLWNQIEQGQNNLVNYLEPSEVICKFSMVGQGKEYTYKVNVNPNYHHPGILLPTQIEIEIGRDIPFPKNLMLKGITEYGGKTIEFTRMINEKQASAKIMFGHGHKSINLLTRGLDSRVIEEMVALGKSIGFSIPLSFPEGEYRQTLPFEPPRMEQYYSFLTALTFSPVYLDMLFSENSNHILHNPRNNTPYRRFDYSGAREEDGTTYFTIGLSREILSKEDIFDQERFLTTTFGVGTWPLNWKITDALAKSPEKEAFDCFRKIELAQ
ncbi:MAG: hypothetical protein ABIJ34_01435 [archaeon]